MRYKIFPIIHILLVSIFHCEEQDYKTILASSSPIILVDKRTRWTLLLVRLIHLSKDSLLGFSHLSDSPVHPSFSYLLSILHQTIISPGLQVCFLSSSEFCPFVGDAGLSAVIQPIVGSFIDADNHLVDTGGHFSMVASSSWCWWTVVDTRRYLSMATNSFWTHVEDTGGLKTLKDTGH